MRFAFARYRRPFTLDATPCEVIIRAGFDGLHSELRVAGVTMTQDFTPAMGPEAVRNHRLEGLLPSGERFDVDAGYIGMINAGIAVRRDGRLVHESHPGRTIEFPRNMVKMTADTGADMSRYKANKVPIMVDIALGVLFYVVARATDLSTAALVGAAVGIALVVIQRFVKVDLTGGLALFAVLMLLISAGLALAFQDDTAVKLRSTIMGGIVALLFFADGFLGGNRLGKGLSRYLPYTDLDPARLSLGMGAMGAATAALNYLVAIATSTEFWLFYTTFMDFILTLPLFLAVLAFARGKLWPRRSDYPAS